MNKEELKKMGFNDEQIESIAKADVIEWNNGKIVSWGSDEMYDRYAVEVMNNEGYYDNFGHYHSRGYYDDGDGDKYISYYDDDDE